MTHTDVPLPATLPDSPRAVRLGRVAVFGLLFAAYDLAYVLSPYWRLPRDLTQTLPAEPVREHLLLALTTIVGLLWAYAAAGSLTIKLSPRSLWLLGMLLLTLGLLNLRALTQGIAFRGDEELHVDRAISLMGALSGKHVLAAAALLVIGAGFLAFVVWRCRTRWHAAIACIVTVALQAVALHRFSPATLIKSYRLVRYPLFETWFSVPPVLAANLIVNVTPPWRSPLCEAVFRFVPFVSAVLLAWYAAKKLPRERPAARALFAMAIGTTPLVFYYSSVTYLEMPAVLMMTAVCFRAESLLTAASDDVKQQPAWYALLMIGFLKETALPFLAAFVMCRVLVTGWRIVRRGQSGSGPLSPVLRGEGWGEGPGVNGSPSRNSSSDPSPLPSPLSTGEREPEHLLLKRLCNELLLCAAVFIPLLVYLFYRHGKVPRGMEPHYGQLLDWKYYKVLGKAYAEQFGALLFLTLAGIGVMVARRRYGSLLLFAAAFCADAGLHLVDRHEYIGYSRFNLFLLPMALVTAWHAIDALSSVAAPLTWAALGLILYGNWNLAPVRRDGAKKAGWGQYDFDTTDHSYPYREAIGFINHKHPGQRVLFAGMWFKYPLKLYVKRGTDYDAPNDPAWKDGDTTRDIERTLGQAEQDGYDLVVFHLYGKAPPALKSRRMSGFVEEKLFVNQAPHALVLYRRRESATRPATTTAPAGSGATEPGDAKEPPR